MTGFDLPSNFNDNPESLVRRVRPHVIIPQKFLSTQETDTVDPIDSTSSAPMAERTIREFPPPPTPMALPDQPQWWETETLNSSRHWSTWCKKIRSLASQMKMSMHIPSTFWRCVGLSLSVELRMMPSVFAYSRSHCSGRRSNGFTQSEMP
jgi:hypothetical protein